MNRAVAVTRDGESDIDCKNIETDLSLSNKAGQTNAGNLRLKRLESIFRKILKSLSKLDRGKNLRFESDDIDQLIVLSSHKIVHSTFHEFEKLLKAQLKLIDELELVSTFGASFTNSTVVLSSDALNGVLSYAPSLEKVYSHLKPILNQNIEKPSNEGILYLIIQVQKLLRMLSEFVHQVFKRQDWNFRAETTYVTLLELLNQTAVETRYEYNEIINPAEYRVTDDIRRTWSKTGHFEELKMLYSTTDTMLFRRICYEVIISLNHWYTNIYELRRVCAPPHAKLDEKFENLKLNDGLASIPPAALHILNKISGEPLLRKQTMNAILIRILPPLQIREIERSDIFPTYRSIIEYPESLSRGGKTVAISAGPESLNDPYSMGISGVGKSTLAAMVARHPVVRQVYRDGIAWISLGQKDLSYTSYVEHLRELVLQLQFYHSEPLFADILHGPGESKWKRLRREEAFMVYAKSKVAEILHLRNVLIILDDVHYESDLKWFQFMPSSPQRSKLNRNEEMEYISCSLLVTTRCRDLLPAADTIEVDLLEEQDAFNLLVNESGQNPTSVEMVTKKVKECVRECANHPLAVKSVGRWLSLKHATAGVINSIEEIHEDVVRTINQILKNEKNGDADMIYEILEMSFSPSINGEPTNMIKLSFAAFVQVFYKKGFMCEFLSVFSYPMIPWNIAQLLFKALFDMEENTLFRQDGYDLQKNNDAIVLTLEALSALGVLKLITVEIEDDDEFRNTEQDGSNKRRFLQIMHTIQQEYGEYLIKNDTSLHMLTNDCERRWNRMFVFACLEKIKEWDSIESKMCEDYVLEMLVSHMLRAEMFAEAAQYLSDETFVSARIEMFGYENATKRQIYDCEKFYEMLEEKDFVVENNIDLQGTMIRAYETLGNLLDSVYMGNDPEQQRLYFIESGRAHYALGFSLAEKRLWSAAVAHWESSQEFLVSALGMVEFIAGILYNVGIVHLETNKHEEALESLRQCLRIRGAIHGEGHILYVQTIQKLGDVFFGMSNYPEAMESYNWAIDVLHVEPHQHRVDIGNIFEKLGKMYLDRGEVSKSLRCHKDSLRYKKVELSDDHPELSITYQHIGECLSVQGETKEAIFHFEEAIRLKMLDSMGSDERDADIALIEGFLNHLHGCVEKSFKFYEKCINILKSKVPWKKKEIAFLLYIIGHSYLIHCEHKLAMKSLKESLQIHREILGSFHLDIARTLFDMSIIHEKRKRTDKALKCLEEALKIQNLSLPGSETIALTHEKIGSLSHLSGKLKNAKISFDEALRIRRVNGNNDCEATAGTLYKMGSLMYEFGDFKEAIRHYTDALEIRRKILGQQESCVADTLYSMGFAYIKESDPDMALRCFKECIVIRKACLRGNADGSEFVTKNEKVADGHIAIGNVLSETGNINEALKAYKEAYEIQVSLHGETNERITPILKYMGAMAFQSGDLETAQNYLQGIVRIQRQTNCKPDREYANVLLMIGNIYQLRADDMVAKEFRLEANQIFQDLGATEESPRDARTVVRLFDNVNLSSSQKTNEIKQ